MIHNYFVQLSEPARFFTFLCRVEQCLGNGPNVHNGKFSNGGGKSGKKDKDS